MGEVMERLVFIENLANMILSTQSPFLSYFLFSKSFKQKSIVIQHHSQYILTVLKE